MTYEQIWSGDWHARVLERVQRLGFKSVTEYACHRPGVTMLELAEELSTDDIAAAQILCLLLEEATRSKTIPQMLRDLFTRELAHAIPNGWKHPLDEATRSEVINVISSWYTHLHEFLDHDATMSAGRDLLNAELPDGWRPTDADDPVIVAFVRRCLGRVPS